MESLVICNVLWYGALAAALLLSIGLFLSAKADLRRLEIRLAAERGRHDEILSSLQQELNALKAQFDKLETRSETPAAAVLPPGGLNVSRRNQILRMHRGGQTGSQIAAALGVPENEVSLLVKVHGIVMEQY
jgi:hypothetical protein